MKYSNESKSDLIKYIRERESSFCNTKLEDFSVTQLIIIVAGIDAKINYANGIKEINPNSDT